MSFYTELLFNIVVTFGALIITVAPLMIGALLGHKFSKFVNKERKNKDE